jgi:hypothetical protein
MVSKPITLRLIVLAAVLLVPLDALAQTCAMLPPGRPSEGQPPPADAQTAAVEAVTRALAGSGITVIAAPDAQRRMVGEPFAECNALECGAEVVRSLGVDYVVLVTVWAPRGTPTSVVVTLIGSEDSAAGDAPIDGDVIAAALSALTTATQRWQASQMGFLAVTSEPTGADVEVDGRLIGQTPLRHLVPAGQRRVRVHLDDYEPWEQTVRVAPTQEQPLEVTLSPVITGGSGDGAPESSTRTEPHFANWIIGSALVAGGIAALISPIVTLATEGDCADPLPNGWCGTVVSFGPQSGVLMGVGIAAIVGGAVFMIAQPIQLTTVVTPNSAMVQLRGTF